MPGGDIMPGIPGPGVIHGNYTQVDFLFTGLCFPAISGRKVLFTIINERAPEILQSITYNLF
jgi:hypothetical protein